MTQPQRILILSDQEADRFLRGALEQRGFEVTVAEDTEDRYERLIEAAFDLVVIDLAQATDGIEFIKRVRATPQLTGILILVVAEWGEGEAALALSQGADGYEPGPSDAKRLITSIERLLHEQAAAAGQTNEGNRFFQ